MTAQNRKEELLQKIKNMRLMDNYYENAQKYNHPFRSTANGISNAYKKINGIDKANQLYQNLRQPQTPSQEFMNQVGAQMPQPTNYTTPASQISNLGNTSLNTQAMPTNTIGTGVNAANTASTASNAASAASNAANTASTVNTAGNALSNVSGAASKAAPVLGLASAGSNFAKGDNVNGAMDLAKTGAMFIPGVGWVVAGAIQIAQMVKNAFDKKRQQAMQKGQEEAAKAQAKAINEYEQKKSGFDELQQENQQKLQNTMQMFQQPQDNSQVVSDLQNRLYNMQQQPMSQGDNKQQQSQGTFKENIPFGAQMNEIDSQLPFDTSQLGQTTSGALLGAADKYLGTDLEGTLGEMSPGAQVLDSSPINRRDSQGQIVKKNNFKGQTTGGAAPITSMPTNYAEESMPELSEADIAEQQQYMQQQPQQSNNEAIKQSLLDKFKNGLNDFSAGYQDNANTDFAHGDLMNGITTGGAAPVQTSGNSFNLGATQSKKGAMARLGEAVGTGQRIMAHPLTQAAIAGMISKAAGGDIDDIAKAAFQYGSQKAAADRYYQQVTGNTNRPFLNSYSAQDVTNKRLEDAMAQRQQQWMYEQMIKKAQQDYTNQFNREKFDYQKEKDKETNALRKEEIAARKEYYKNRGNSRQPVFDPTTVPGFYDDYQSYEEDQNIINDPELYNKEWDDMLHAMYGDRWFYSDKQRQDAKNELDKRMNKNKNDFYRKYRINPMKGKKA